ncbi:DUF1173 family protein [Nocardia sp. NPDC050710]|uniref:DUF1173 family protein n=1 Tax=Nocardia sp. NPDC050710 TaxID=3157220 RepID=UPI0033F6801D
MDNTDQVRLAGRRYRLADLRADPEAYRDAFTRARSEDQHAVCLCHPAGRKLVIRRTQSGRHFLARWPGEAHLHATACPFYESAAEHSGRSAYAHSAIRETEDGVSIRVDVALRLAVAAAAASTTPEASEREARPGRRSATLLGLVHWLWEVGRLNSWQPSQPRRMWRDCHAALSDRIAETTVNRQPLSEVLYVVPPFRPETADAAAARFEQFLAGLGPQGETAHRGLVLGEIRAVGHTGRGNIRYDLCHHRRLLVASQRLHETVRARFANAYSEAARKAGGRRIGVFAIERSPGGHAAIIDMAVMLTSPTFVPADSSHELTMTAALVAGGVAFEKPLRYDATELVLPDFVLTDAPVTTVVEVWGREDPEYLARKAAKQAHYRDRGTAVIEWSVGEPLPDLRRLGRWSSPAPHRS